MTVWGTNYLQNLLINSDNCISMKINDFGQYGERANYNLMVRLTKNQKIRIRAMADASGFKTVSGYIRFTLFNPTFEMKLNRIIEILKELQEKSSLTELSKKAK